jgi:methylated-DNA-[protein]-cysteine S-methyltransferase
MPRAAGPPARAAGVVVDSAIGPLRLEADADGTGLTAIRFAGRAHPQDRPRGRSEPVLEDAACQLDEYFAGTRRDFTVPLAAAGTDFQLAVWRELVRVPWGCTVSYGEIARRLGLERTAARAVGSANGANPIPIVVPCHRVIGADGSLTGYAGGLARKRALLLLEGTWNRQDSAQLELF